MIRNVIFVTILIIAFIAGLANLGSTSHRC